MRGGKVWGAYPFPTQSMATNCETTSAAVAGRPMKLNLHIEKIENGLLLRQGHISWFCKDVDELHEECKKLLS